jgi:hypothetical protein
MWFRDGSDKGTASNVVQILENVRRSPWQWLDKCSVSNAWAVRAKSKLTETEKDETGEEQYQMHAHHFLWHQGDCSQRIRPGRPHSPFCILLWHFMATVWECGQISPWTLATKNWLLHYHNSPSHTSFFKAEFFTKNIMTVVPHRPYFSVFSIEDKTEMPSFWHNWGDRDRFTGGAEHPQRPRFTLCI